MDHLLAILKRHQRFLLVVVPTVLGGLVIYSLMVPSAREQAQDSQRVARAAQSRIIDEAREALQEIASVREDASLTDTIVANRRKLVELEAHKDSLLTTLAYQPPPDFRLPEDEVFEHPADYQHWFGHFLHDLRDEFRNDPAYSVVRSPDLRDANLLDALGLDTYLDEAGAWAGVVEPAPDTGRGVGTFLRRGPSGPRRPAPLSPGDAGADAAEESPEARAKREMEAARAETQLRLLLLSMVVKVIQAGFVEESLRIQNVEFIPRGGDTTNRFNVSTEEACFFRPIRLFVEVEATEAALMDFLNGCIEPGEDRQFLSLDRFRLIAEEALLAEPQSDRVRAEVEFLGFLIDPEQPFQEEEEEANVATGSRLIPR